jgi:hypothetical protein
MLIGAARLPKMALCGLGEIAIDARQDRLQTGLRVAHLGLLT